MIDTIFYFATTMDEYRNLVEEQQISARTIVFVEETQEIYKNGKLYPDISGIKKAINNASTKSWQDTVRAIGELNNELREAFNASITDTNASLAEARTRIENVKTILSKLTDSQGNALINTDQVNGLIELFAEYWNVDNQTYTNFENIWNAQAGKAGLTGEFVNTVNEKVNEFQSIVDIVNGRKDEWIKSTDINGNIATKVGQLMSAEGGILRNYVTTTQVNPDQFSTIYNEMNLAKGTYESINARLNNNEQIVAGWQSQVDGLSATTQQFSEFLEGDEYAFLSSLKTYANGDESYFDLTAAKILGVLDEDNENKVAAKIFGYVKNNVSNLELTADNIQIGENVTLTDELSTIKGKLLVDGDVTAKAVIVGTNPQILINSTDGIKHTGGKFQINMDGSGFFGNENSKISWIPDGTITATGINITSSNYVPEGWNELKGDVANLKSNAILKGDSIKFIGDADTVELSLANGLKHYKTNSNPEISGYNLKNDGSGYVANGIIAWNVDGSGSIGTGDKKITWTSNGELVLGSGLIVGGGTTVVENPYDDTELKNAIAALNSYNTDRAYLKNTGILFENKTDGNLVGLTSVNPIDETSVGGLIHTYIDANGNATTNPPTHGYALYNDGTGSLADGYITWGTDTVDGQKKAWMKINGDEVKITYVNNNTEVVKSFQQYINDKINLDPYITNDELQSALNGVLKTGDLDGYLNSESLKNNAWLLQQIENLQGQIDVLNPDGESVDVNAIVEAYLQNNLTNEVNEVLGNTLNNYVLNETLQTTLLGYATKGELPDLTGYMKTDSLNMDFAIVAENKNYDPNSSEVEEKQHYLTDPQYVSTEGNYTNDLEKALKVTIAEMLSKIDKLAAYFVDENGKVNLLSSIGIDTQIHDYLTNDTAYSGLINWANGILGGVKSAGFTLNAFIAALSSSVWNEQTQKWESPTGIDEDTKEEINITGIVDKFNSELRLDASQIVTGADGTNSSNVTLLAKLSDIENTLGNKAEASVVTGVSDRVQTIEDSGYLTSSSDISDKVLGYLANNNLIKSNGNQEYILNEENIDLSKYILKSDYTEAISGLITKINNAESSMVSTTTREAITRRNTLLDKKINGTINDEELAELNVIEQNIARRDQLIAKKEENGELISYEQEELDQLIGDYGNKENPLEDLLYEYITTTNRISSAIDNKVASIDTYVTKESIFNEENGTLDTTKLKSGVKISADQINIGDMTLTNKLATIEGNLLVDGEVAAKSLHSTQNGYHVEIQNGIIEGYKKESENDTPISIYKFNNDGSGSLANGNITWTSNAESLLIKSLVENQNYISGINIPYTNSSIFEGGQYSGIIINTGQFIAGYSHSDSSNNYEEVIKIGTGAIEFRNGSVQTEMAKIYAADGSGHVMENAIRWYIDSNDNNTKKLNITIPTYTTSSIQINPLNNNYIDINKGITLSGSKFKIFNNNYYSDLLTDSDNDYPIFEVLLESPDNHGQVIVGGNLIINGSLSVYDSESEDPDTYLGYSGMIEDVDGRTFTFVNGILVNVQ